MADANRASGFDPPQPSPRRSSRLQGRATSSSDEQQTLTAMDLLEAGKRLRQAQSRARRQVAFAELPQSVEDDAASEHGSTDPEEPTGQNLPATNPFADAIPDLNYLNRPKTAVPEGIANRTVPPTRTSANSNSTQGNDGADDSHMPKRRVARVQQLLARNQAATFVAQNGGTKRRFDERDDGDRTRDGAPHHRHHNNHHDHHNRRHQAERPRPIADANASDNAPKRLRDDKGNPRPVVQELPDNALVYMLSQLWNGPHALSIEQISGMFELIQDRIWGGGPTHPEKGFVQKHFAFVLNAAQCAAWPLHELKTKYLPLFMATTYLADGSQYGWRSFFTQPQFRQNLVGAILGEWFTQRIFKHTAFGLPQSIVHELEETDREYLHFDAVVRTKKRAELLDAKYRHPTHRLDIQESVKLAADKLADEILEVLQPLLPPPVFDPLDPMAKLCKTNAVRVRTETLRASQRAKIREDLVHLILDCAALHMGIRFTGRNGTIVRVAPHLQKGSKFYPTAPMVCMNGDWCNQTAPTDPAEKNELCIKTTCWPRVEAVVPHGPDMDELGFREREYRNEILLQSGRRSSRPRSPRDSDLDTDTDGHEFTWNGYDDIWPVVPDELQDEEGKQALKGETTDEEGRPNTEKRAAYMTVYACVSPSMVCCEWTPQPTRRGQSLAEAVLEARRAATGSAFRKYRVEDLQISLWNTWALYGGLTQWGIIVAGLVISISRYLNLPSHTRDALLKAFHGAKLITTVDFARSPKVIADAFQKAWKDLGPFATALAGPMNALIIKPVGHVFEWLNNRELVDSAFSGSITGNSSIVRTARRVAGGDVDSTVGATHIVTTASMLTATRSLSEALTSTTREPNVTPLVPDPAAAIVDTAMDTGDERLDAEETGVVDQGDNGVDEVGAASSVGNQKSRWQRVKEAIDLIRG